MTTKRIDIILNKSAASKAAKELDKDVKDIGASADKTSFAMNKLSAAIAAVISVAALNNAAKLVQNYQAMAERIQMATKSTAEYEMVQRRLLETANGTYRELAEAQELFVLTQRSLKDLGYETEQVLDITDSLSYSFVRNATSQERAAGAIDQLSKSIQKGKVEADSWATLLAATPTIVDDIATATGRTTAEISRLGATGKLSITDLTEGLRTARDVNKQFADGMSVNLVDAGVRVRNAMTTLFVEIESGTGVIQKTTDAIVGASEELTALVSSGQMTQIFATFAASLEPVKNDIITMFGEIESASNKLSFNIHGDTQLFSDAFKNIIPNIRSFIQIATVELASFVDKSRAYGKMLKEVLNPFDDVTLNGAKEALQQELDIVDSVRAEMINSILKSNEEAIAAQRAGYDKAIALREEYEAKATISTGSSVFDASRLINPAAGTSPDDKKAAKNSANNSDFVASLQRTTAQLELELKNRQTISQLYRDAELAAENDYFAQERIMFEARTKEQIEDLNHRHTLEKEQREYQLQEALAREGLDKEQRIAIQQEYDNQRILAEKLTQEQITAVEAAASQQRIAIAQQENLAKLNFISDMASSGLAIAQAFGSKSEKNQKRLAKASILADTATGIARGVSLGWPLGIPAVAWAIATGATALSRLNSSSGGGGGSAPAAPMAMPTQTANTPIEQNNVFTVRMEGLDQINDDALLSGKIVKEIFGKIEDLKSDGYSRR